MFNRPDKTPGASRAADLGMMGDMGGARRSSKAASLITEAITIDGNVAGDGELHVDCVIRGDVSVARLSIGETGRIEGAVTAEAVEVRGAVVGAITARQVRLHATARLEGDVTHEELTIEPGARFEGRSQRMSTASPPPPLEIGTTAVEPPRGL